MATTKAPVVSEKAVQAQGIALLRSIGGLVYVIGHPSPADGRRHRGTGQTPGLPDVFAFLPPRRDRVQTATNCERAPKGKAIALWWEAKRPGGRVRPEQQAFRDLCVDAEMHHVLGDLDALIGFLIFGGYLSRGSVPHYRQPKDAAPAAHQES